MAQTRRFWLGFLVLLLPSTVYGQEALARKYGIMQIECPDKAKGTAFVVAEPKAGTKLLATSAHVVVYRDGAGKDVQGQTYQGNAYTLKLEGLEWKARVVSFDYPNDTAILASEIAEKFEIPEIATPVGLNEPDTKYLPSRVPGGFLGYANGGPIKDTVGFVSFVHQNVIYSDAVLIPGQSGGPMLVDGKIAGVIQGGWIWVSKQDEPTVTWPARCTNAKRLREMVEFAKERVK